MTDRTDPPAPKYEEPIRKTVGQRTDLRDTNSIRRGWRLRQRMIALGIEFDRDEGRLRKVVGGPQRSAR
jgi:hypothetical protein